MNSGSLRRHLLVLLVGAALIGVSFLARWQLSTTRPTHYRPPPTGLPTLAATPEPTVTARSIGVEAATQLPVPKPGAIVVDLAHLNQVSPLQFQPLAARLAARGLSLYFWMTDAKTSDLVNLTDLPDQSAQLAALLQDATGLIVVSPTFLWKPSEVAVVERFVADGGRLLLISDPDLPETPDYLLHDLNTLARPFGVVFNDDYLYDTTRNDRNYTHVFQTEFLDRAAELLRGKTIVFYGARSLSGPAVSLVRSGDGTISSLRSGFTHFTTVALAGQAHNGTADKVLAMGDFDVLTEPYVGRYDNASMLEFVADFLSDARRTLTVTDFPSYLGKQVALVFGDDTPIDASLLAKSAALQRVLENTEREMTLGSTASSPGLKESLRLTPTLILGNTSLLTATGRLTVSEASTRTPGATSQYDTIYLASYRTAAEKTDLLSQAGFQLLEQTVTPIAPLEDSANQTTAEMGVWEWAIVPPTSTPVVTPQATAPVARPTATMGAITVPTNATSTPTSTPVPSSETPAALTTPVPSLTPSGTSTVTLVLGAGLGPRLVAADTVLVLRRRQPDGSWLVAVLGSDATAVGGGVNRMLTHSFDDCTSGPDVAFCPNLAAETAPATPTPTPGAREEAATPAPSPSEGTPSEGTSILLIDDNKQAGAEKVSEAGLYRRTLTDLGFVPDQWATVERDNPGLDDLKGYYWVIWSGGLYQGSSLDEAMLGILVQYVRQGGRLTVSGRHVPTRFSTKEPSVIADVVKTDQIPELVAGLPDEPVQLAPDLPPVRPFEVSPAETRTVVLRRGPNSQDADAPLMLASTQVNASSGKSPRVVLIGMALNWLPQDYALQLIRNLVGWMMAD